MPHYLDVGEQVNSIYCKDKRHQSIWTIDKLTTNFVTKELPFNDHGQEIVEPWRPIHYLGSKLRFVSEIGSIASNMLPPCSKACDLFSGSGTVAGYLAEIYQVTAVDIQEYSRAICSALLNPAPNQTDSAKALFSKLSSSGEPDEILSAMQSLIDIEQLAYLEAKEGHLELLCDIIENGALVGLCDSPPQDDRLHKAMAETINKLKKNRLWLSKSTTALRYFGGVYFSYQHAADIDRFRSVAEMCESEYRDTFIAASLTTASELVNTVGKHFAQPLRPRNKEGKIKSTLLNIVGRDRFNDSDKIFFDSLARYSARGSSSKFSSQAIRADFGTFLETADLEDTFVYADPPYTRDHYSRFYHVLETLALRDNPEISTNFAHGVTRISRGLYRKERHQSPFCIRSQAPEAFENLFERVSSAGAPLILSYSPFENAVDNHPRVMGLDKISEIAARYFREVEIVSAGAFSHSRLNKSSLHKERSEEAEKFVVCRF